MVRPGTGPLVLAGSRVRLKGRPGTGPPQSRQEAPRGSRPPHLPATAMAASVPCSCLQGSLRTGCKLHPFPQGFGKLPLPPVSPLLTHPPSRGLRHQSQRPAFHMQADELLSQRLWLLICGWGGFGITVLPELSASPLTWGSTGELPSVSPRGSPL